MDQIAAEIVAANPGQVESYRKNPKALGWFVGQVMKATAARLTPSWSTR